MTFLTNSDVTEILYIFGLVPKGKAGKEIYESSKLEFLEKFSENNFALSDAEEKILGQSTRGGTADLLLLRTLSAIRLKSCEPSFWVIIDSCFISLSKSDSLNNLFATITTLSELHSRCRRFMLLVQTKELVSMSYGSSTSNLKPRRWMKLDLLFTMSDVSINSNVDPFTKFSSSSSSRNLKIQSHGTFLKWSRKSSQSAQEYS